jgi:hypothetical protein
MGCAPSAPKLPPTEADAVWPVVRDTDAGMPKKT